MTSAVGQWSEAFARAGVEAVVAYDWDGPRAPGERATWVRVSHRGPLKERVPIDLRHVLHDADLLVLHSGWTLHNLKAAADARAVGVPYILEPRGAYDPHIVRRKRFLKKLWWRFGERALVEDAAAIHVFFEEERVHLEAIGYRGPVVVAPNGVDPGPIGWSGGGGYVLWLGRFDPEHKGLDLLLGGMAKLPPEQRPLVRINGPDWRGRRARVERLIRELDIEKRVLLGPPVYGPAKKVLLSRCDAFIYPSRWDACPNATLEAVAMGIPTIVTPYPLGVSLARQGAAILVDRDPAGIADGLRQVAGDVSEIGRRASLVAAQGFDWDHVARLWLEQVGALV